MKYKIGSLIFLLSEILFAGGDIAPILPIEKNIIVDNSAIYLGVGASNMSLNNDFSKEEFSSTGIMLLAGYQFNEYISIEGRYTKNIANLEYDHGQTNNSDYNDYPGDFSNIAIYLKPSYSFNDFSIYGLLGYGEVTLTDIPHPSLAGSVDRAEDGFQWGLGASYMFMNNISIFADYVNVYDDKGFDYRAQKADINSELWTLGVSYKF